MEKIYYNKKKNFQPAPEMIEGFEKRADFIEFWWGDSFFKWFPVKKRKAILVKLWNDCKKLHKPEKVDTE